MAETHHFEDAETGRRKSHEEVITSDTRGRPVDIDPREQMAEIGGSKSQFADHVETAETGSFHEQIPEIGRKASSARETAPALTWGERVFAEWQKADVLGPFGDMAQDSPEYARTLRAQTEEALFPAKDETSADAA